MKIIIETQRLLLRTFTIDDADLTYELNSDAGVIKYTAIKSKILNGQERRPKKILP